VSQSALLLGISRADRGLVSAMEGFLKAGVDRTQARSIIQSILKVELPQQRFISEWGVLEAAQRAWGSMNAQGENDLITEGYRGTVRTMPRKYKTVMKFDILFTDTGVIDTQEVSVFHDRFLTRKELRELGVKVLSKGITTNFQVFGEEIQEGFRSR
tara:strand:+ start:127 stop:597 length:471 start_codon:yes stop_codon:yes gene_type:complete